MRHLSSLGGFMLVALLAPRAMADAPSEQPKTIPLDQIWAFKMPGTRDIGRLETDKPTNYAYGPLVAGIRRALSDAPSKGKQARTCFAVNGTGLEALRNAHDVLVKNNKPRRTFPAGSVISVVFFSRRAGSYVHLHEIQQQRNAISIRYRFVPHETREVTDHLALIPFTNLAEGKVRVEIIQSPMEKSFLTLGFRPISEADARGIVCQSTSFTIVSERKD